jgi:tripartite-type tricarboxylate transporter receptor subunit TctC
MGALLCAGIGLFIAGADAAGAQDYPQRAVTIVVPFPAGGATDVLTRLLAAELHERLGQPFVIENRPGAGATIAATAVARAAPDGYTLLLAPTSTAIAPSVYKSLAFDPVRSFAPIALVGTTDFVPIAHPSVAADDLPGLIALMRGAPGAMSYASAGFGTPHHLMMAKILKMAGATAQHVPYRGSPAAMTDLLAGLVPLMMCDMLPALPMIRAGKVKAFGVAEAGLPGFAATTWFSLVAPAGTPRPIVDTLNRVVTGYLSKPDTADKFASLGLRPLASTPEELGRHIASEQATWAAFAAEAGITPQ